MTELEANDVVPKVVSCHEQIISMINMIHLGNYIGFLNVDSFHRAMDCGGWPSVFSPSLSPWTPGLSSVPASAAALCPPAY